MSSQIVEASRTVQDPRDIFRAKHINTPHADAVNAALDVAAADRTADHVGADDYRPLERPVLRVLTLDEQLEDTDAEYVVIVPNGDGSPVLLDEYTLGNGMFIGRRYLDGVLREVVSFPTDSRWIVYSTALVEAITFEQSAERAYAERRTAEELYERLNPAPTAKTDSPFNAAAYR